MTINTKFNINDDIYFMKEDQIRKGRIYSIDIVVTEYSTDQPYKLKEVYAIRLYGVNSTSLLSATDIRLLPAEMHKTPQSILQLLAKNI